MNKVILTGNLTKDPELRKTQNGTNVVSGTVAVRRERKDVNGDYPTDFINFVAWGSQADYLANYAYKCDRIELCGRWETRTYENRDGQNVLVNEVQVETVSVFSKQPKQETQQQRIDDDDLPF